MPNRNRVPYDQATTSTQEFYWTEVRCGKSGVRTSLPRALDTVVIAELEAKPNVKIDTDDGEIWADSQHKRMVAESGREGVVAKHILKEGSATTRPGQGDEDILH